MSSLSQNAGLDAAITLKVFYDGATRRAKMPLREMVPDALEKHLRAFLHIPDSAKVLLERYSDSAAAYVWLDPANTAVYKQLYRAAKAKLKLKLRVTILGKVPRTAPRPVSIEDEPETSRAPIDDGLPVKTAAQTPAATIPAVTIPVVTVPVVTTSATTTATSTATATAASSAAMTLPLRVLAPCGTQSGSLFNDPAKVYDESSQWEKHYQSRMDDIKRTTDDLAGLATHLEWQLRAPAVANAPSGPNISPPSTAARALDKHVTSSPATGCGFAVCCNSCENTVPGAHYHCSTCDDGDFDLCQSCVDQGITCYSNDHWLIKRTMENGQIVNSITETIASKPQPKDQEEREPKAAEAPKRSLPVNQNQAPHLFSQLPVSQAVVDPLSSRWACPGNMRTCNCCVQELPEREFLHCATCEDYDLCLPCFAKDAHGHHPKHAFVAAVAGTEMPDHIKVKMLPGRNQMHHAICDGCDKYITGVRHKCLDCPDWDYCSNCVPNAHFIHANHRFAPIYESLTGNQSCPMAQTVHVGICCDGPLCSISQGYPSYIRGIRYKCAVCNDLDFCANCEASPANVHNRTHPLVKFKTPVRHVSVTTTGEHQDGKRMPAMGDRNSTLSKAMETGSPSEMNSMNAVQTVVDVKPVEATPPAAPTHEAKAEPEVKQEKLVSVAPKRPFKEQDLRAVFVRDSIQDGTILPPNHVFEQTWVLRNEGQVAWPAGCSVKYVGGDYMGHVDSAHPAGILELVSASESTVCYAPLAPGQEFSFTVLLRTPVRPGKIISYWRLTTQDGFKFGHRLWCEVNVRSAATDLGDYTYVVHVEDVKKEQEELRMSSSNMIFPKLEKESPSASMHEEKETVPTTEAKVDDEDGFEDCGDHEDWDASEDGFLTDEEYDILDASDEEFLEEQKNKVAKQ